MPVQTLAYFFAVEVCKSILCIFCTYSVYILHDLAPRQFLVEFL
jgi:hypothetical protein